MRKKRKFSFYQSSLEETETTDVSHWKEHSHTTYQNKSFSNYKGEAESINISKELEAAIRKSGD